MKLYTFENAQEKPVSHNPELKKRVLVPEGVGCVRHISRLVLKEGSTAVAHSHRDATEVFYCVTGVIDFSVNGQRVALEAGSCLIVEPGEEHSITGSTEGAETVYMMVVP